MPTRAEFEAAAEMFSAAAHLVHDLVATAAGAGATQILHGGSLGREIPKGIEAAEQAAVMCEHAISQAVDTCLERAAIIADYEVQLRTYEYAYGHFERASRAWASQYNAWFLDDTGTVAQPINPPRPPVRPAQPPSWAEVRRL